MSVYVQKYLKTLTTNKNGSFVLYILERIGRNFARHVNTRIRKVFFRKEPLRFYANSRLCVCFEVHIPAYITETSTLPLC